MSKVSYKIRKTIIEKRISVFLNDSLGDVLEFDDFEEVSKMCEILNVNSDSNFLMSGLRAITLYLRCLGCPFLTSIYGEQNTAMRVLMA